MLHPTMRAALAHLLPAGERQSAFKTFDPVAPVAREFRVAFVDSAGFAQVDTIKAASATEALELAQGLNPGCHSFKAMPAEFARVFEVLA